MHYLLPLLAAFALFAAKPALADFVVSCEGYYPEPESPMSTTIIASVQRNPDGSFAGLHCSAAEGDPQDVCAIQDGGCCGCNVARGYTPECSVTVEYGETQTIARCLNMFPPCYYGNACEVPSWDVLAAAQAPAVVKRNGKRVKPKKH